MIRSKKVSSTTSIFEVVLETTEEGITTRITEVVTRRVRHCDTGQLLIEVLPCSPWPLQLPLA